MPKSWAKGTHLSAEHKEKLSAARKLLNANGWKPGNFGKKMNYSESHIAKLMENLKHAVKARKIRIVGERVKWPGYKYVMVYQPDHPSCNSQGYVHEHRLIAERVLGRRLKRSEVVHHVNGDKSDNRHQNLLICSASYHHELHRYMSHLFQRMVFCKEEVAS